MSTAKLQKIPSVILAVSVNGIKFIDARTKVRYYEVDDDDDDDDDRGDDNDGDDSDDQETLVVSCNLYDWW